MGKSLGKVATCAQKSLEKVYRYARLWAFAGVIFGI